MFSWETLGIFFNSYIEVRELLLLRFLFLRIEKFVCSKLETIDMLFHLARDVSGAPENVYDEVLYNNR